MVSRDPSRFSIGAGETRVFSIAGLRARLRCELDQDRSIALPSSYRPFLARGRAADLEIRVASRPALSETAGSLLYDSKLHWRALSTGDITHFELVHPPTSRLYCRASVDSDFTRAEIVFAEAEWLALGADEREWLIPHPLDQLLLAPALALRGVALLHACGAVLEEQAMVFAGHSGDGKTTLSGLLAKEGVPLLSDERVAVRRVERGFLAYGTPWPGEGNIVSPACQPLKSLFVLRKAESHSLARPPAGSVALELIARAIVPYYLPEVASRILALFDDLAGSVPMRELHFARLGGLRSLLQAA